MISLEPTRMLPEGEAHEEANALRFKLRRKVNPSEAYSYMERYIEALRERAAFPHEEYRKYIRLNAKGERASLSAKERGFLARANTSLIKSIAIFGYSKYPKSAVNELKQIQRGAGRFARRELRHYQLKKERPLEPYFTG